MSAIGIDLGTTYSCVAVLQHGKVEVIANDYSNRTTPSCVAFTDTQLLIGEAALRQIAYNNRNTLYSIKRFLGREVADLSEIRNRKHCLFNMTYEDDKIKIKVDYKGEETNLCFEEISALILKEMKYVAETYLRETVQDAVITVPAYFNNKQRQATRDAAKIAGLNILRLINEPTAAAIAYGYDKKVDSEANVLMFDLGGGTLDVSIIRITKDIFEVKATSGDTNLGGEDFDSRLIEYCVGIFNDQHRKDISKNQRAMSRLRIACELAKRDLSRLHETNMELECLFEGIDFSASISRNCFEQINADLFNSIIQPIEQALLDAKLKKNQIHEIVLVGGSTRIPKIQQILQNFFNRKSLTHSINPDEAVAYGAAVHAALLSAEKSQKLNKIHFLDVTPFSLGIATPGGIMHTVIERNTPIPTKKTEEFVTIYDNLVSASIKVLEGERAMMYDNNLLGEFMLNGIPSAPQGVQNIVVTFEINEDGIIMVSATVKSTGKHNDITIMKSGSLSKQNVDRMVAKAKRFRTDDRKNRDRAIAKNDLERFVYHVKQTVEKEQVRGKILESDRITLLTRSAELITWLQLERTAAKCEFVRRKNELEKLWKPINKNLFPTS